jgi:phage shock protein A
MGLMERVSKLIHADIDALVEGSDEPEQVINQVVLDMQNQLMQLKTQIAVASGHERILAEKQQQKRSSAAEWLRKAELAADKKNDELARVSLLRHGESEGKASQVAKEIKRYQAELENLKYLLHKLERKMEEAQRKGALMHVGRRLARGNVEPSGKRGAVQEGYGGTNRVGKDIPPEGSFVGSPDETKGPDNEGSSDASSKSARIDRVLSELKSRVTK